jgi:hypothetical protein
MAVKAIARRLRRLENQLSPTNGKPTLLLFACNAAQELALDDQACKQILRENGFLSTGVVGVIDLTSIPDGLSAEEMERFLRENAAEICGFPPCSDGLKTTTDIQRHQAGSGRRDLPLIRHCTLGGSTWTELPQCIHTN